MGRRSRRQRHAYRCLVAQKRQELPEISPNGENQALDPNEDESDIELGDIMDDEQNDQNRTAFSPLMDNRHAYNTTKFRYARGHQESIRTLQRRAKRDRELSASARKHGQPLTSFFSQGNASVITQPVFFLPREEREKEALQDLQALIKRTKNSMTPDTYRRHHAVELYLNSLVVTQGKTRKEIALNVASSLGKAASFARNLMILERTWLNDRSIELTSRGSQNSMRSLLMDEGVRLFVRSYIEQSKQNLSTQLLADAVGLYWLSRNVTNAVMDALHNAASQDKELIALNASNKIIRACTARRWLKTMGFEYKAYSKDVYIDGHERADVIEYRQNVFVKEWIKYRSLSLIFQEDGSYKSPGIVMSAGITPFVLITHDESTFNSNDDNGRRWIEKGKQPLKPKGRGKGIMVSAFLTPIGLLEVPQRYTDDDLLQLHPPWPVDVQGKPIRQAVKYHEYGPNNYWTGDLMVKHAIDDAIRIVELAFPDCQGLFAFDNASNHAAFADDALNVSRMNLNSGGKQSLMRPDFNKAQRCPQSMIFERNDPSVAKELQGKAKGLRQVLKERQLWNDLRPDGTHMVVQCGTGGCAKDGINANRCCARKILSLEEDFQQQKGKLQEEIERLGHKVIFYPKFHCELNFIERFWCSAKRYARDNCTYSYTGLKELIPKALASVSSQTFWRYHRHCESLIDAYAKGLTYQTTEFTEHTSKVHRRIKDSGL